MTDDLEALRAGDAAAVHRALSRLPIEACVGEVLALVARATSDQRAHSWQDIQYPQYVVHESERIADVAASKLRRVGRSAVAALAEHVADGGGSFAQRLLYELAAEHLHALGETSLRALERAAVTDALRRLVETARGGDDDASLEALRERLETGNQREREDAIRELGLRRGCREAARILLPRVHLKSAARAFRAIGPALAPEDLDALAARVARGAGEDVCRAAAEYDDPRVAEALFARVVGERAAPHAASAFAALRTAGEPYRARLLPRLLDGVGGDAWHALGAARGLRDQEVAWLCDRIAPELATWEGWRRHGWLVRLLAARAAPLADPLADPLTAPLAAPLTALLAAQEDSRRRVSIASALARIDFAPARPTLERALDDRAARPTALAAMEEAGEAARACRPALERLRERVTGLERKRVTRLLHALG